MPSTTTPPAARAAPDDGLLRAAARRFMAARSAVLNTFNSTDEQWTELEASRRAFYAAAASSVPTPLPSPAFWMCRICGAANEIGERTCARCDRDSAADEAAYSRYGG